MSHPSDPHRPEDVPSDGEEEEEQHINPEDIVEVFEVGGEEDEDADMEDGEEQEQDGDDDMEEDGPVDDNSLGHSLHHAPSSSVFSIALHPLFPSPPLAISGGEDDSAFLFCPLVSPEPDAPSPFRPIKLSGHTDSVIDAKFSHDGEMVATGGMDGKVRVWRRVKGKAPVVQKVNADGEEEEEDVLAQWQAWEFLTSLDASDEVTWISWHPKGPVLAAGCNDSTVWMWQLPSGNTMQVFSAHTDTATAGYFTPSGKNLITTSADSTVCVWDPRDPTPLLKLARGSVPQFGSFGLEGEGGITALAVAPSSNLLAIGGSNGSIRIINLPAGNVVGVLGGHREGESVEGLAFMDILGLAGPGGEASGTKGLVLVSCGTDHRAIVWDVTTGKARAEATHADVITSIAPHPAPRRHLFTSASADRTLRTWDARTGTLVAEHKGHAGVVNSVAVARAPPFWGTIEGEEIKEGDVVVSAGDDGAVLAWRV